MVAGEGSRVIVGGADFVLVGHPPGAVDIENAPHVALAKSVRHLRLGLKRALALENALGIGELLGAAVMQAGAGGEMRMAVEIAHGIHFLS